MDPGRLLLRRGLAAPHIFRGSNPYIATAASIGEKAAGESRKTDRCSEKIWNSESVFCIFHD